MKRLLSLIMVVSLIVGLTACSDKKSSDVVLEETISMVEHNQIIDKLKNDYDKKLKENIAEVIQLPKLEYEAWLNGELHYNEERDVYAYIDNVGFEVIGNVNIYEPKTGVSKKLTSYDYGGTDPTVKKITWLSENQLLMIVGFAYGTVTVGGSVFVLSIDTGEVQEVIVPGDREEIVDIVKPLGGQVDFIFVVAKWDENFMEYETFNVEYGSNDIKTMIGTDEVITIAQDEYNKKNIDSLSNVISGDVLARLIKETDEDLLISVYNYGVQDDYVLQVNKDSYEVKNKLTFDKVKSFENPIKITEGGFFLKSNEDIKLYNYELDLIKVYHLPKLIKDAMIIANDQDRFGGYDVSSDMSKFVFCDEEGLKIIDDEVKTIIEPLYDKTPDDRLAGYPMSPIFVGTQNNIMAMISGYEGYSGFYYYHRLEDDVQEYRGGTDRNFTRDYNGSKLINISPYYSDGYGDGLLMSVEDGSVLQMDRDDIDNDGNLIDNQLYYDMDDQILSIDYKNSVSQLIIRNSQLEIIQRANLKSDKQYVRFSLIGARKDGRVLLLELGKTQNVIELSW